MAQLSGDPMNPGRDRPAAPADVQVAPGTATQRDALLSILLTGTMGARSAARRFQTFATEHKYNLDYLWGAWRGSRCVAAALVVPCPGRTGMVFLSPQDAGAERQAATQLVRRLMDAIDPRRITLAQALLDPAQSADAAVLEDAGARRLAQLLYLERRSERRAEKSLPSGLVLRTWSPGRKAMFAEAIERSYDQTLDCPGLVGMRDVEDVIEGHKAAGEFDPRWWRVLTDGKRGLGVLLLNGVPNRSALELVYLGLAPEVRGQGLGGRLVELALDTAARARARQVILAVDQANHPALALYRSFRFVTHARKLALLFALSSRDG